ncbi:MAG: signal peptidase I [Bacteroidia bacterium]|nr:signal peptidase I [Bacteroidia bacterium]NNM23687.1 signal peptidase I [Flavobacteriaceae bacterium]
MTLTGWLLFFLIVQLVHFLGTWKLYVAAGRKAWEAGIPIYNAVVLMQIINRPRWWVLLLFIPIVNLIMFPVIWVETARSFGFNKATDTILVLITLGLYLYYINYTQKLQHIPDRSRKPRTSVGEWTSSILFAVVAATLVHTYFMQPFTIPTSSLEKTLLVGDYLFVSKIHYGARAPITAIALPMVHDRLPVSGAKSYYSGLEFPYLRFPGFQDIKHNDIVVFSWPVDEYVDIGPPPTGYMYKPIDKKSNYVKRCVALPGDSLEIKNGYVHINGKKNDLPDRAKLMFYQTVTSREPLDNTFLSQFNITEAMRFYTMDKTIWDDERVQAYLKEPGRSYLHEASRDSTTVEITGHIGVDDINKLKMQPNFNKLNVNITEEQAEWIRQEPTTESVEIFSFPKGGDDLFPNSPNYQWEVNNYGPIYIPKAGATVNIDTESIPFYKRIIEVYEGSELGIENVISQEGTQVLLNGEPITQYTFKQDYYWMMGDNRNNSQDARMWGYVPFNHVVGKPVFIWMSLDANKSGMSKVRWDRVFTTVGGSGAPVSYFKYFLIVLGGWFVFSFFRKRKKKKPTK